MQRILVVDDEPEIVEIVGKYLRDEGFAVSQAFDGSEAVAAFESDRPDLIVLDLKLPVMSGLDAFRKIRAKADVPVVILTSRTDEIDRIVGLELGADDYVTKPFSPRELVARIKTVLRRTAGVRGQDNPEAVKPEGTIKMGDLEIDRREHEVRLRGKALALTPTEFRVLEVLALEPGRTFSRVQLLDLVRGQDLDVFDRTLDRHIANVRHKIEDDSASPRFIQTVFGIGYKMAKQ